MLVVLLAGQAMASMDAAIVTVAAPSIRADLDASGAATQLILVGYLLSYGACVVTGARIGARIGPRAAFLVGLAGFLAASLAAGLATGPWLLVAARVGQGTAGAVMVPQVIVFIQCVFDGEARARAVGYYSLILSVGVLAGQSIGGALTSADLVGLGWRPLFLLNVPVGLVVLVLAHRHLPRLERTGAGFDIGGTLLLGTSMLALLLPLVFGPGARWPLWMWVLLLGGAAGVVGFGRYERRRAQGGRAQLLDLSVLADRRVAAAGVAVCAAMGGYSALVFALTLHMQESLGLSALQSGATIACYAAGFGASSLFWRTVCARVGIAYAVWGYAGFGVAVLLIAYVVQDAIPWYSIPPLIAGGWCHAVTFAPLFNHVLERVEQRHAAELSGLLSTATLLAAAASIAGLGSLYLAAPASSEGLVRVALVVAASMFPAALCAAYAISRSRSAQSSARSSLQLEAARASAQNQGRGE